jgi:hypothetical protein
MDNGDYYYDKEKFDAVWRRVTGAPEASDIPAAANEEAARLRSFMDDEAGDAPLYERLAGLTSGCRQRTLLRLCCEAKSRLKKLRACYYILKGETHLPPAQCPVVYSLTDALRHKYTALGTRSDAYLRASAVTTYTDLSEVYRTYAMETLRHRKTLAGLIEKLL